MFESIEQYPQLKVLIENWEIIRDEAVQTIDEMLDLGDWRSEAGLWKILPLLVEEEDQAFMPNEKAESFRRLMPKTVDLVEQIPNVMSFALSMVESKGFIKAHQHGNPYVSSSLCLQSGGRNAIIVENETQYLEEGQMAIFDYRKFHAVYNWGNDRRIALIVALPKKPITFCRSNGRKSA